MAVQIRLLGPFDVRLSGQPMVPLRSRRGQWLLAQLALRQGREVDRTWLAGVLWPDSPDTQALASLRRTLTDLRAAMGDFGAKIVTPTPKTLVLLEDGVEVDAVEFDRLAESDDLDDLSRACSLYRGTLLEGCAEEWVLIDRQSREETFLTAAEKAARLALEAGQPKVAISLLKRAVAVDPFRESATRSLMQACAANGDQAAAVLAYRQLRERLLYELNSDPSAETNALLERIRKEARAQAQRTSIPISPVAAVEVETRPAFVLPSEPANHRKGNLPEPLTDIVGREQDMQEVEAHLLSSRLVTLLGPGGIGKTRLSIEVARSLQEDMSGGAWFVDFTPLKDSELVPQLVEHALGVHERQGTTRVQDLVDAIGREPTLLVLDNCEHLIDACADLADALLKGCAGLRILATSREPLGLTGEIAWRVPSLAFPEERRMGQLNRELAGALLQYDAVRLFMSRAQAASPGFELTLENASAIVDVCRRLDGIALAIELAAARLRVLTVQQISERLSDRFKLLTGGSRGAPTRQQTLRAALEWSYDLLSEPERVVLRRLSVFGGLFVLQAAEAVTAGEPVEEGDALDLISKLVDKSWVRVEVGEDRVARYRLLETTREFARELLEAANEAESTSERHASYYSNLVIEAGKKLEGPDELEAMRLLERVYDNIRIALQWNLDHSRVAPTYQVAQVLTGFWSVRERGSEGRLWLEKAVELLPDDIPEKVRLLQQTTYYSLLTGEYEMANRLSARAIQVATELGQPEVLAMACVSAASAASEQGRHDEALALHARCLEILGGPPKHPRLLTSRGLVQLDAGLFEEAAETFKDAIRLCEETGTEHLKGWNCSNLGDAFMAQGRPIEAIPWYREGLSRLATHAGIFGTCEAVRGLGLACALGTEDRHLRRQAVAVTTAAIRNQGTVGMHLRKFDAAQRDRIFSEIRAKMGDQAFEDACAEGMLIPVESLAEAADALAQEVLDAAQKVG
ncbi:MAG: tetratricopeptide repeat protein [Fimbriimonadaceae bacterium]|nr:tetratricopeptide repeat protein [Fimbriimonadaceae bacterium]